MKLMMWVCLFEENEKSRSYNESKENSLNHVFVNIDVYFIWLFFEKKNIFGDGYGFFPLFFV